MGGDGIRAEKARGACYTQDTSRCSYALGTREIPQISYCSTLPKCLTYFNDFYLVEKEHAYRTQVAKELLATEESYVAKLRQVVDV